MLIEAGIYSSMIFFKIVSVSCQLRLVEQTPRSPSGGHPGVHPVPSALPISKIYIGQPGSLVDRALKNISVELEILFQKNDMSLMN